LSIFGWGQAQLQPAARLQRLCMFHVTAFAYCRLFICLTDFMICLTGLMMTLDCFCQASRQLSHNKGWAAQNILFVLICATVGAVHSQVCGVSQGVHARNLLLQEVLQPWLLGRLSTSIVLCSLLFLVAGKLSTCWGVLLLQESPAWPILVESCAAAGVRLGLLNARMSSRAFMKWFTRRMSRALLGRLLGHFSLIVPQSDVVRCYCTDAACRDGIACWLYAQK